jgi:hypothetical protein
MNSGSTLFQLSNLKNKKRRAPQTELCEILTEFILPALIVR